MTVDLRPWRRLLPIWLPAVGLCVIAAAAYLWQSSESGGRAAGVRGQIEELEAEIARLEAELDPNTIRIEAVPVRPKKSDISVEGLALVWCP